MTTEKDAMHEALRKTELALAHVLHAADFVRETPGARSSGSPVEPESTSSPQQLRLRTEIINCIRKLRINRELGEYYYIAVAGGQSAGKTRIIRELYNLDETWLSDNEGRGERLPVFVIETPDITEPFASQVVLNPQTRLTQEEPLDSKSFKALIKGEYDNAHALYPKLHVPQRHFSTENIGFVLLPGFEVLNEGNSSWQEVMRHTLRHALGCLFVTDKTRLADSQQIEMQKVLSRKQFAGREFAVAISKTENASIEARDDLRRTAIEVFNLTPEQEEQVVCTGTGRAFVDEWSAKLIAALDANSRAASTSFELRLNDLSDVAEIEVLRILGELDRLMQKGAIHEVAATNQRDEVMQAFTDGVTKYRRRLAKELGHQTEKLAAVVRKDAIDAYIAEEEGFDNTVVKGIKRFFNTTSGERERIHIDRVYSRWTSDAIHVSDFTALSNMASNSLGIPIETGTVSRERLSREPLRALGYDRIDGNLQAAAISESETLRAHVVRLLKVEDDTSLTRLSDEERSSFKTTLKLIPALTMEYLRVNQAIALAGAEGGSDITTKLDTQSLGEVLESTVNGLPQFKDASTNLLRTIGCILAVDVAIDGTVDTIPGLIHAVFGGGSAAGSAAAAATGLGATLSMAAAGVMGVGYVAYQSTTAAQRADAAHRGFIRTAVTDLAARHVDRWMEIYDDAMERVGDRLRESLTRAYNLDTHLANNDALLRAMSQLELARLNLVRNVSHATHSLV
jgi:hypothetical protein